GVSVAALLESMELEVNGIAVALNMEIVRRGEYGDAHLSDGDEVEIVRAVGGG
ncbi:MAG: sulfur carrier protein ThiS, partial [Nitrospinae bacterium]|nr:sulfur carrier protein ThiS [Nitrospinota bacterium]